MQNDELIHMSITTINTNELYSRKKSAERLGLTPGKFDYLLERTGIKPYVRHGDKHSNISFTKEQLKQLNLAHKMFALRLAPDTVKKIVDTVKATNYEKSIWLITFEDTIEDPILCFDEDLDIVIKKLRGGYSGILVRQIHKPL